MQNRIRSAAFTLIELIGVIAIIALLAALLIPRIVEVVRDAAVTSTVSSINNVRTGVGAYYNRAGTFTNVSTGFDDILVGASFLDKPFSSKLGAADVKVVTGASGSTLSGEGAWALSANNATASPTSGMTTADKVVIATITGLTPRDAIKLNEVIDGETAWTAASGSDQLTGKLKATTSDAGATYNVQIYIAH